MLTYISAHGEREMYDLFCTFSKLGLCDGMTCEEEYDYEYIEYVDENKQIDYFEETYISGWTISWKDKNE